MATIRRFDHVGITVADLDTATPFFVRLGCEVEGRASLEGAFAEGYSLVGGVGEYEGIWLQTHVRGPEGIVVSLAERNR